MRRPGFDASYRAVNLLLRFDRAQLAIADVALEWLWTQLEISRRMLMRLALAGMLLSELLAQVAMQGRVEIVTLAFGALLVFTYEMSARRLRGNPELERMITLANRRRPFSVFLRLAVWPWTGWSIVSSLSSRALPLELASAVFFVMLVFASAALPPSGPRKRRRREVKRSVELTPAPIRFGAPT